MAVQWRLSEDNHHRIAGGTSADDAYPDAVQAAEQGFDLLASGLARLFPAPASPNS
jgi:hypothetical protein